MQTRYWQRLVTVVPLIIFISMALEFVTKANGINLHDAFASGAAALFSWPRGGWWWAGMLILTGLLMWYLHPLNMLAFCQDESVELSRDKALRLTKRMDHLGRNLGIAMVVFGLIMNLVMSPQRQGIAFEFLPFLFQVLESSSTGLFTAMILWLILENSLFQARRIIVMRYPDVLPHPSSLYGKVLMIILVMVAFLTFQIFATSGYFLRRGMDMSPDFIEQLVGSGSTGIEALIHGQGQNKGLQETLVVFYFRAGAFLFFIMQLIVQIKFMIKRPLDIITSRLEALKDGQGAKRREILIFQNNEYTKVYRAINHLIRQQERELALSRDQLDSITENAADPILVYDADQIIKVMNPAACEYFGYTREEALGRKLYDLVKISDDLGTACTTAASLCPESMDEGCTREWEESHFLNMGDGLRRYHCLSKDGRHLNFEAHARMLECEGRREYTVILRDIEAQLSIEQNLTKAKQAAENANRMKSEFLATMSHELRTPLNAVLGFTQLLSLDRNLTPSQQERVATIARSGEHLLALINDILDISKIEAGKVEMHASPFDLERFVDDIRDMFELKCKKKGLSLYVEHVGDLPRFVEADIGKLRQVVINLVGNAVKFTSEGGIGISVGRDEGMLRFAISDSGRGIPADEIQAITQPFIQSSITDHEGGTGLGLAISLRFIEMMGGTLDIKSELGKGSVFSFAIPLVETTATVADEPSDLIPVAVKPGREVKVLVVDDKETNRLVLKEMLTAVGMVVMEAENGREAVDRTIEIMPDLVFMDIRMPVMDGYEAVAALRADTRTASIPVFALTASAFRHDEERIQEAGFSGFLAKPFKRSALFQLIRDRSPVEMVYETPAPVASEWQDPDQVDWARAVAAVGPDMLERLGTAALINDFASVRDLATELDAHVPDLAGLLRYYAADFDEEGLANLVDRLRSGKENR